MSTALDHLEVSLHQLAGLMGVSTNVVHTNVYNGTLLDHWLGDAPSRAFYMLNKVATIKLKHGTTWFPLYTGPEYHDTPSIRNQSEVALWRREDWWKQECQARLAEDLGNVPLLEFFFKFFVSDPIILDKKKMQSTMRQTQDVRVEFLRQTRDVDHFFVHKRMPAVVVSPQFRRAWPAFNVIMGLLREKTIDCCIYGSFGAALSRHIFSLKTAAIPNPQMLFLLIALWVSRGHAIDLQVMPARSDVRAVRAVRVVIDKCLLPLTMHGYSVDSLPVAGGTHLSASDIEINNVGKVTRVQSQFGTSKPHKLLHVLHMEVLRTQQNVHLEKQNQLNFDIDDIDDIDHTTRLCYYSGQQEYHAVNQCLLRITTGSSINVENDLRFLEKKFHPLECGQCRSPITMKVTEWYYADDRDYQIQKNKFQRDCLSAGCPSPKCPIGTVRGYANLEHCANKAGVADGWQDQWSHDYHEMQRAPYPHGPTHAPYPHGWY